MNSTFVSKLAFSKLAYWKWQIGVRLFLQIVLMSTIIEKLNCLTTPTKKLCAIGWKLVNYLLQNFLSHLSLRSSAKCFNFYTIYYSLEELRNSFNKWKNGNLQILFQEKFPVIFLVFFVCLHLIQSELIKNSNFFRQRIIILAFQAKTFLYSPQENNYTQIPENRRKPFFRDRNLINNWKMATVHAKEVIFKSFWHNRWIFPPRLG